MPRSFFDSWFWDGCVCLIWFVWEGSGVKVNGIARDTVADHPVYVNVHLLYTFDSRTTIGMKKNPEVIVRQK